MSHIQESSNIQQASIFGFMQDDDSFDCGNCNQFEMNQMALREAEYYDSLLNVEYKIVMKFYESDPVLKQKIRESQRAWLKMRDQNKEVMSETYKGGSIMPLMYHKQVTKDTKNRIRFLEDLTRP